MKHTGSCDRHCGHQLLVGHVIATPETQRALDGDPRVVEYYEIPDWANTDIWYEFLYAWKRPVAAIHVAKARQLGITDLEAR